MTRAVYGDEGEDFPGQWALQQANLARRLTGKAGRALLLELREAMLAMPRRRLIEHKMAADGDVCAVGVLIAARRLRTGGDYEQVVAAMSEEERQRQGCQDCYHERSEHEHGSGVCVSCALSVTDMTELWDAKGTPPEGRWKIGCAEFEEYESGWEPEEDDAGALATVDAATEVGVNRSIAWRLMDLNDQELGRLSPERRWRRVIDWIDETLGSEPTRVVAREVADYTGFGA